MEDLSVLLKRALLYFDKNKYLLTHNKHRISNRLKAITLLKINLEPNK